MLDKSKGPSPPLETVLEPELIAAITKLLDDRNTQVRVAAAITLYSLNRPSDKVNSTCTCRLQIQCTLQFELKSVNVCSAVIDGKTVNS